MNISRRQISNSLVIGASSCLVNGVYAQAAPVDKPAPKPYREVNVPGDKGHVLFFFDFECSFCAKYHPSFMNWSATAPKSIKVSEVPVVNASDASKMREQIISARCYFAAKQLGNRDQLNRFVDAVYENVANDIPINSQTGWIRAVQRAGIDLSKFGKAIGGNTQLESIRNSAKQVAAYQLDATPSVAIDGNVVITPDNVNGNQEYFFTLLNGLASKMLTA